MTARAVLSWVAASSVLFLVPPLLAYAVVILHEDLWLLLGGAT